MIALLKIKAARIHGSEGGIRLPLLQTSEFKLLAPGCLQSQEKEIDCPLNVPALNIRGSKLRLRLASLLASLRSPFVLMLNLGRRDPTLGAEPRGPAMAWLVLVLHQPQSSSRCLEGLEETPLGVALWLCWA